MIPQACVYIQRQKGKKTMAEIAVISAKNMTKSSARHCERKREIEWEKIEKKRELIKIHIDRKRKPRVKLKRGRLRGKEVTADADRGE